MPLHFTVEFLALADGLEIQLGQGVSAGVAQAPFPHLVRPELHALR